MTLHVVIGPPAAGKTTYVTEHAQPGDIRIDYDLIANTLAGLDPTNHDHTNVVKKVTKAARDAAIQEAQKHTHDTDVWLIHSTPTPTTLDHYRRAGARIHTIDPGKATVMHRIKNERPNHMHAIAGRWYQTNPDTTPTTNPTTNPKPKPNPTTTQRGLGHKHQQQRRRLLAQHTDGTPCSWCGKPMYKDPTKNFDHAPLEADHTHSRRDHGPHQPADRLLHRHCNRQRGAGDHDHQAPIHRKTNTPPPTTNFTWG